MTEHDLKAYAASGLLGSWRDWTTVSVNRKIFQAALSVAVMAGVVSVGMVVREVTIAAWFGTSDALEAYLIAILIPTYVINVVGSAFSSSVIPAFVHVREIEGREAAQRLFSHIMTLSVLLLMLVTALLGTTGWWLLPLIGSAFSAEKIALTRILFFLVLPLIMLNGLSQVWSSVLNAGERFVLAAVAPIAEPLIVVAALFIAGDHWGIFALASGSLVGCAIQTTVLAAALKRYGMLLQPRWNGMDPGTHLVVRQYLVLLAGCLIHNSAPVIDQTMAAMLGPGSVAALNYGNKVVGALQTVGAMALGTAVMPYFSRLSASGDLEGLRDVLRTYTKLILVTIVPITILLIATSQPLVKLIFQRGAFTAADTDLVAHVQAMFLIQLPFFTLGILGVRLLSARFRNLAVTGIAIVNITLKIGLNYLLMSFMGVSGIALATSAVYMASQAMILAAVSRDRQKNEEASSTSPAQAPRQD
ncbi:MAG: polysaccharide biosynthesis C-terminal domain-containing protein [Desulfomonile sp.]|nr:polysaccharide biosynthesis C-terminal domain-containing protein [Desulfomonile sp.]